MNAGSTLLAGSTGALSPNSALMVNGTLDLCGFSDTAGRLGGNGTIEAGSGAANLTVGGGLYGGFSGSLADGGAQLALVVAGGTLELSGTNNFSGATTVNAGAELDTLSAGALSAQSPLVVNGYLDLRGFSNAVRSLAGSGWVETSSGAATVTVGGAGTSSTFAGTVCDSYGQVALVVAGGTLTLSGSNGFSGATTVNAGATLLPGSSGGLSPNSALVVNGTLDLHGFSSTAASLAGSGTVESSFGAATLVVGADGTNTTFSGTLADGGGQLSLGKTGGGTLTLGGTNSYTGGTAVCGGTLRLGNSSALGSASAMLVVVNGGGVDLNGYDLTVGALNGSSDSTITDDSSGGGNQGVSTITIDYNPTGNYYACPAIADGPNGRRLALVLEGSGESIISAADSYTGGTTIGAGCVLYVRSAAPATMCGEIADNGVLVFAPSSPMTWAGAISGTGPVFVAAYWGATTVTFGGDNTDGGGTFLYGSTLVLDGVDALGSATGSLFVNAGATLDLDGASVDAGSLSGDGTVTNSGQTLATLAIHGGGSLFGGQIQAGNGQVALVIAEGSSYITGDAAYLGGTTIGAGCTLWVGFGGLTGTISGDIVDNGQLIFAPASTITYDGVISGSGSVAVEAYWGPGTVILTGGTTDSGGPIIYG